MNGLHRAVILATRTNAATRNGVNLLRRLWCNMSADSAEWNSVLDYWFGGGDPAKRPKWFGGGDKVTKEIELKFKTLVDKARSDQLRHWEEHPKATLALIILQDQFCRSLFKGTTEMYHRDEYCLKLSKMLIEQKHKEFDITERMFLYMPLMHSESREDQGQSVDLYTKLMADAEGTANEQGTKGNVQFAKLHKEVVDMFGRFPQRNKILGRKNTAEEEEWLKDIPKKYVW